jgi:hypothetical protein
MTERQALMPNRLGVLQGSAFAFVEYDDYRDADDAIRKLDNYNFMGKRVQTKFTIPSAE